MIQRVRGGQRVIRDSHKSVASSGDRSCLLDPESFTSFTLGVSVTMVGAGLAATAAITSLDRCFGHLFAIEGTSGRATKAPLECRLRGVCAQPLTWASPSPCARADTMAAPAGGLDQSLARALPAWGWDHRPVRDAACLLWPAAKGPDQRQRMLCPCGSDISRFRITWATAAESFQHPPHDIFAMKMRR